MTKTSPASRQGGGRHAQAAENDKRILDAAVRVLTANPDSPMSAIAARAHVGIGSLYRRFPSKNAVISRLCLDAMERITNVAHAALDTNDEQPWESFTSFLKHALAAGAGSLQALAGTFPAGRDLVEVAIEMNTAIDEFVQHLQATGAVRLDITANDVLQLFEMVRSVKFGDETRTSALQRRYLDLLAPAFRAPPAGQLSEPPPTWQEILSIWVPNPTDLEGADLRESR